MIIACDKETMKGEGRVALMPDGAKKLGDYGAEILVAQSAGVKSGYMNNAYRDAGATITSRDSLWRNAHLIVRVKQPLPEDFKYFRSGLIVACFGHLAANLPLLECLINTGVTLIDYGTIERAAGGSLHILARMSELAGEIAVVDGEYLLKKYKGKILRDGTKAAIVGMGNVGLAAANRILPTGAKLYCFEKSLTAIEKAKIALRRFSPNQVCYIPYDHTNSADQKRLAEVLLGVDLLIGGTHERAKHTGKPVPEGAMKNMEENSVAVDVSIDQGGCFETSSDFLLHGKQIFKKYGVWHYCVPNMPGSIPRISTPPLANEIFPYIYEIATKGFELAVRENLSLRSGIVTHKGWITCEALAQDANISRLDRHRSLCSKRRSRNGA